MPAQRLHVSTASFKESCCDPLQEESQVPAPSTYWLPDESHTGALTFGDALGLADGDELGDADGAADGGTPHEA